MQKQLRFKIGDKVRILECEYSDNTQTEGFEGVIATLYEGNSDYQYRIDIGDKTDKYGDPYTLMADDEIELVETKKEEVKVDKVKLPKEIAEALDFIDQTRDYPIRVVVDIFNGMKVSDIQINALDRYFEEDRSRRIEKIVKALIVGYEVELTPEQKLYELWTNVKVSSVGEEIIQSYYDGMTDALKTLGIKIKGINC